MKRWYSFALTFIALSIVVVWVNAQSSCPEIVSTALSAIDQNCNSLERNSACYGYNLVQASFLNEVPEDFFTKPTDRTPIGDLASLQTAPLSESNNNWGVALMSVQANVPDSLPGQAVTFVLLGDVEVENATTAENGFQSPNPLEIVVITDARVRSGAGFNFNTITVARAGTSVSADAISADGEWVRVVIDEYVGWMNRSVVQATDDLTALPVYDGSQHTPMQAFYLRTGVGEVGCSEAQSTLMVQGPKNIKIDLTVNGANMTIGSTVLIRTVKDNLMEIIVIDGEVTLKQQGPNGTDLVLRTGYKSQVCLSDPNNLGLDGQDNDRLATCGASEPQEVDFTELGDNWCQLEGIPSDTLFYPVDLLCDGEDENTYLENVLTEEQKLPPPPALCDGLALVSPLETVPFGTAAFIWNQGVGIEQYAVNLYALDGSQIYGYIVAGDQTSVGIDTTTLPGGDRIQWEVLGLVGGNVVCTTGRTGTLVRDVPPPPYVDPNYQAPNAFTATWSCGSSIDIPFSYSGADAGDTVFLYPVIDGTPEPEPPSYYGESVSDIYSCYLCYYSTVSGIVYASPSGKTFNLPTLSNCASD